MTPASSPGPPQPDVLSGWVQRRLNLSPDAGPIPPVASLVHPETRPGNQRAVLYVHGFVDYFFQTHHARVWQDAGFDFHALDLRDYGRSLQPGRYPNWVLDLATYDEEIGAALSWLAADYDDVVLLGHSTGGLVVSLYAHRHPSHVSAVVLNSPWLDLNEPWLTRTFLAPLVRRFGRLVPRAEISQFGSGYGRFLHTSTGGEWDYNLEWKPLDGFGVYTGWLAAILDGHHHVKRGLDIPVPVLMATSDARGDNNNPTREELVSTDVVLDPKQMWQRAFRLGRDVTVVRIPGGIHDLSLSPGTPRQVFHEELTFWLNQRFKNTPDHPFVA